MASIPRHRQAWDPRHPDSQKGAHEISKGGKRLQGISIWRTDCQEFESCVKLIKGLAFKSVQYLFRATSCLTLDMLIDMLLLQAYAT